MASTLRQRSVVSSFICKPDDPQRPSAGFKVAIFKRSQDVSTYRGKWAACSGSIEKTDPSPEEAAKREILEETTLTDSDIYLFHRGKPFSLVDEGLKTEWTINPFTWMMKAGSKDIKFDWEHTEYAFIDPKDLKNYETVPNLEFGLKRCLVGPETQRALDLLRDDHDSGAQQMASSALKMLLDIGENDFGHIKETKEFWREWRLAAWHLAKEGRPSMGAAIEAALLKALDKIQARSESDNKEISTLALEDFQYDARETIQHNIASVKHSLESLGQRFLQYIVENEVGSERWPPSSTTILTLSSSGTIKQCLIDLIWNFASHGQGIKLYILESRPNFEGVAFAGNLLNHLESTHTEYEDRTLGSLFNSLKIKIVSDASVGTVVKDADYVVLGADKVLPNGEISNKIGSLAAAVMAKTLNPACKVVSVFTTDKVTGAFSDTDHLKAEYNESSEMIYAWPSGSKNNLVANQMKGFHIDVKNAYFEWVPAKYIDQYVSEQGALRVGDIQRLSGENGEREQRIFGDL